MKPRVIKSESEYEMALAEVERLVSLDPGPETPQGEQLALLAVLVQSYESERFPFELPDPVSAIKFRMEQKGLSQRDLIPYFGSGSRVSEVLSNKRPLTLRMIRALHAGLEIPAEVLLHEPGGKLPQDAGIEWERFPIREMAKRGWVSINHREFVERAEEVMRDFLRPLGSDPISPLYRRTISERSAHKMDRYSLIAWTARVLIRARSGEALPSYRPNTVTVEFMREVARLSWSDKGPLLAQEFLSRHGIRVVVEPHLPRTHLDGAAMIDNHVPIVGLTLRHDRIDNFWFCLLHELAHISLHLASESGESFLDDLDSAVAGDEREAAADKLAADALIPDAVWVDSKAKQNPTPPAILEVAHELRIHPAIVAGRVRHDAHNFRILSRLVGHGKVRELFPTVKWSWAVGD